MIDKVMDNIKRFNLIRENDNIVVGVSGGPDSMALLYVLLQVRDYIDINIYIAHVNHGVRGDDALSDRLFVQEKAKELNLPFYYKDVDMVGYAKEKKITAEEAGRELRYGFFRKILSELGAGKIAVAHNKNDQAETLLLRIMRGTGIDGLRAMELINGDIIRPILNVSREDIENYISKNQIETVLDKTNLQSIYNRNKVRLELIPFIKDNFNPNIIDVLWRLSQTAALDSEFLHQHTKEKYNLLVKNERDNSIILKGTLYNLEDKAIRLRIIRMAIFKIKKSLEGLSESNINSLDELFLRGETGKQIDLPGGLIGRISYDNLIIEYAQSGFDKYEYELFLGENLLEKLNLIIDINVIEGNIIIKDKDTRCFDYDKIKGRLILRNRRNGDRIVPYGMNGSKKLKDYFIDMKIPKDKRDKIPILLDDENIIWVCNFVSSELYKVTENTKRMMIIKIKNI